MQRVSPAGRLFLAERLCGQARLLHCVKLFFAPRAWSSRSGCALSAALRHACARDRVVPLAARPLVVRPSAAHVSTQRSARSGPARSGAMAPVARGAGLTATPALGRHARKVLTRGDLGPASVSLAEGWGASNAGAADGKSLRSPRVPDARAALGRRRRSITRTARGPGAGRPCPAAGGIAAGGVSACSDPACGGRANAERPRTRRAKKNPARRAINNPLAGPAQQSCHAVEEKELAAHPLGGLNTPTHHSPRLHAGSGPPPALRVGFLPPQGASFE
jgi:hypothetical protein